MILKSFIQNQTCSLEPKEIFFSPIPDQFVFQRGGILIAINLLKKTLDKRTTTASLVQQMEQ